MVGDNRGMEVVGDELNGGMEVWLGTNLMEGWRWLGTNLMEGWRWLGTKGWRPVVGD